MKERFLLSKKHSCNRQYLNVQLDNYRKNKNECKFYSEMDELIGSYGDFYDTFLITFNIDREKKSNSKHIPSKEVLTQILKKTFNRLHSHYFGKNNKHRHLDFIRIGTYGSGREESCFDHYHFLICMPQILLPVLEKEFNYQVTELLKGFKGKMHWKKYSGSIQNFLTYGTRYYSNSGGKIRIFDGIEVDISSLDFSLKSLQTQNAMYIKKLHADNNKYYNSKHNSEIVGKSSVDKIKNRARDKEDPFSDSSMYDFRYRGMF